MEEIPLPTVLPALPGDAWINLLTDPREIDAAWLQGVLLSAPVRVQHEETSHNAADPLQELIQVGLVYIVLVWNPFVTAIATEAGKAAYVGTHNWLRSLFAKLAERKNPIVQIHAFQNDCAVSFMFRGTDVKRHYSAHDELSAAAVQAARLIRNMKERGMAPAELLYEYHSTDDHWFPSYAKLSDGRLVTDNAVLIAVEQLPSGLSLGIKRGSETTVLPVLTERS